ncbi:hypothetical protein [Sorangium sp. So ce388]|uniref:hypothetical protein n=1 Tax=Sorangium sp. So ce388 TaxID=3133309 RepID=UPI003F5CAA96
MDLKTNGAVTKSWRTTVLGFLSGACLITGAISEAAGLHPSIRLWAFIVGAICGIAAAALSADHTRLLIEIGRLAKAIAELQAQRQADAIRGRQPIASPAPVSSVPELDVPFSGAPAAQQDTIPEAPPVAVPISPKEPQ